METCICDLCGKPIKRGYVWDNIHVFCTKKCASVALDNDMGCVNILIDDGAIVWQDNLEHFRHRVD